MQMWKMCKMEDGRWEMQICHAHQWIQSGNKGNLSMHTTMKLVRGDDEGKEE